MPPIYLHVHPVTRQAYISSRIEDIDAVIFMVKSPSDARSRVVAESVRDLHNRWIHPSTPLPNPVAGEWVRAHTDTRPALEIADDLAADSHCVYLLVGHAPDGSAVASAPWTERTFHIGQGVNERYLLTIGECLGTHPITEVVDSFRLAKHQKINEVVDQRRLRDGSPRDIAEHLVRPVARYGGKHAAVQALAVENFLITHWADIYRLTNRGRGALHHPESQTEWLARPHGIGTSNQWRTMVKKFADDGRAAATQGRMKNMLKESAHGRIGLGGLRLQSGSVRLCACAGDIETTGVDVFIPGQILKAEEPWMRLQFKISSENTGLRLNLRPTASDDDFIGKIAAMFFQGDRTRAQPHIMNLGKDAYFKPCASNLKGNSDLTLNPQAPDVKTHDLANRPMDSGEASLVSFNDILGLLMQRIERCPA